jgi:hypothetical protein
MVDPPEIIPEHESRHNLLLAQLSASPLVDVVGVVSPPGVGGWLRSDGSWILHFTFHAWRIPPSGLQTQKLAIYRKVTHDDFPKFRKLITPYTVLRIRARVVVDSVLGDPRALLEDVLGPDSSDVELTDQANQLQKPVTFVDAVFGTFTLNRDVNWFTAEQRWLGRRVSLNLCATAPAELQALLQTAHSLWKSQDQWNQRIREYAVKSLLSIKNEAWLDDGESELTADQFKNSMILEEVTVYPDGSFDFCHNDGDLFAGHLIQIRGSLAEGPTDAGIEG